MVDVRSVMEFWDDYCMYLANGLQSLLKTFLYNLIPIHLQNLDFGLIDVGRSTEAKFIQEKKKTFFLLLCTSEFMNLANIDYLNAHYSEIRGSLHNLYTLH